MILAIADWARLGGLAAMAVFLCLAWRQKRKAQRDYAIVADTALDIARLRDETSAVASTTLRWSEHVVVCDACRYAAAFGMMGCPAGVDLYEKINRARIRLQSEDWECQTQTEAPSS